MIGIVLNFIIDYIKSADFDIFFSRFLQEKYIIFFSIKKKIYLFIDNTIVVLYSKYTLYSIVRPMLGLNIDKKSRFRKEEEEILQYQKGN